YINFTIPRGNLVANPISVLGMIYHTGPAVQMKLVLLLLSKECLRVHPGAGWVNSLATSWLPLSVQ
ncbi:MAG: hypothetical protein MJE68_15210, partial [Proteobacteria bacterium]|nr:hypothetical protein [Pseudomonadota bacterium]